MKIVYCTESLCRFGGIERGTIFRANALANVDGNEVWVCVTDAQAPPIMPLDERVHLVDLEVRFYEPYTSIRTLWSKRKLHKQKLEEVINDICPDVVIAPDKAGRRILPFLKYQHRPVLIRELRSEKHHRLHTAVGWRNKAICLISEWMDYTFIVPRYDCLVVLTEEEKLRNWKNNSKVVIMPNFLMENLDRKSDCKNKVAIAIGRLHRQKNFKSAVNIWAKVVERHSDWVLQIWGAGEEEQALRQHIAQLGLEGKVCLMGYAEKPLERLADASIYMLTSIMEGLPNVLMEAMSEGLPSVSYTCPTGPLDLIEDGCTGFLVKPGDEQTFAERVCQLIEQPELRCTMGQAALQASERYRPAPIVERWMRLFQRLVEEKRK